jgi:hypothetical protein
MSATRMSLQNADPVETETRGIDDASTCTARPGQLTSPPQSTAGIDEHEPGNKLNKINNLRRHIPEPL